MYLALYGPQDLVIFDHPYNADSARRLDSICGSALERRLFSYVLRVCFTQVLSRRASLGVQRVQFRSNVPYCKRRA